MEHKIKKQKIPIILYEQPTDGSQGSIIPYIEVGIDEEMPKVLFISEYKATGEEEYDINGVTIPIYNIDIHAYADMKVLKNSLDEETNDKVRIALGLLSLKEAQTKGQKKLDQIYDEVEKRKKEVNKEKRTENIKRQLEFTFIKEKKEN